MMRVKYIEKTSPLALTNGRIHIVLSIKRNRYRLKDDTGEDYLYPPELFAVVKE